MQAPTVRRPFANRWRILGWGMAAALLATPLVAMRFTAEVKWTFGDFAFAAIMIASVGGAFELAVRASGNLAYRSAVGFALAAAFLLVWINGAVGIIGDEGNPANLMYGGVLAVALGGALVARFGAAGMARAMMLAALAQVAVGGIALACGLGEGGPAWPRDLIALTGIFAALWGVSAGLFARAGRETA